MGEVWLFLFFFYIKMFVLLLAVTAEGGACFLERGVVVGVGFGCRR